MTIPTMLGLTAVAVFGAPMLVPAAVGWDVIRFRWRLPTVRVYAFCLRYAFNDSAEILAAPVLWVWAGFGRRLEGPASIRRHQRLQAWSIDSLARWADRLLGLRLAVDDRALAALEPGPVIVLCRHVSIIDASLPGLLYQRLGYQIRAVIMAELLADPGFDLLYGRLGSVFIARDDGEEARRTLAGMGRQLDGRTAVVIYPEGRLFRPAVRDRALARLAGSAPERAERLQGLRHLLPPRPGGVTTLLDALPGADVVVLAHAGLDRWASFADLARAVPVTEPIRVTAWRVPRTEVPDGPDQRTAWLDQQWLDVDAWVEEALAAGAP